MTNAFSWASCRIVVDLNFKTSFDKATKIKRERNAFDDSHVWLINKQYSPFLRVEAWSRSNLMQLGEWLLKYTE